jgi:hypothetical protein
MAVGKPCGFRLLRKTWTGGWGTGHVEGIESSRSTRKEAKWSNMVGG